MPPSQPSHSLALDLSAPPTQSPSLPVTPPPSVPPPQHLPPPPHLPVVNASHALLLVYVTAVVLSSAVVLALEWTIAPLNVCIWLIVNAAIVVFNSLIRISVNSLPTDRYVSLRKSLFALIRIASLATAASIITAFILLSNVPDEDKHLRSVVLVTVWVSIEAALFFGNILLHLIIFFFALTPVIARRNSSGASKDDLSKFRTFRYVPEHAARKAEHVCADEQVCTICLCEYKKDDVIKELPCSTGVHIFHASCVDPWLMQKASCPICRDDPLARIRLQQQQQQQQPPQPQRLSIQQQQQQQQHHSPV